MSLKPCAHASVSLSIPKVLILLCCIYVLLYITHTQSQAQSSADKLPNTLVATKQTLPSTSAEQALACINDEITAIDNYSKVSVTTTSKTTIAPATTMTATATSTPVSTAAPVASAASAAAAAAATNAPTRTIPPAPPLPPSYCSTGKEAYKAMIEERNAIALAAAAKHSATRRYSTGSCSSVSNSMLQYDVAPRVSMTPPPPAYLLKHLLSLKAASGNSSNIWRRNSTGSSSSSKTSSSSASSSTTSSTSSAVKKTRSRKSTSRTSQSRSTRATQAALAVAVAAVEPASSGVSVDSISSSTTNSDSTTVRTSPTYSNMAEDTLQRATVVVSGTLQSSCNNSVSSIFPPPPAEVFHRLINKRACSSSRSSSTNYQAQPTAAAVSAAAAAAAVTPHDDNTAFINRVLARRHTLPTEKLSSSELTSIVASARLTVAAEQSHFNSNPAPTAVNTSIIASIDTTATDNTVVEASGNTELAATSESGVSTSTSGSSLAVRSLTSESAAAVQAARSASTSSSSSSNSSSASQTLRRPTRPTGRTAIPGSHGSIDRVLQCEADSHSNIRAYERSMSADVGSTFHAQARQRVDTVMSSKRSTVISSGYSTQTAAAIARRLLNCSDSIDDDLIVHTAPVNDCVDAITEVFSADSLSLSVSTRTSSSSYSNSLDYYGNLNNSNSGNSLDIHQAWAVLTSVGSSSSSGGTSCDVVSTPVTVTSASAAADTQSSAASSKALCTTDTVAIGADKIASAVSAHSHTAVVTTVATTRRERSRSPARTGGKRAVSPSPTRGVTRSVVAA
jgi:trimeric autotransporter adhesin